MGGGGPWRCPQILPPCGVPHLVLHLDADLGVAVEGIWFCGYNCGPKSVDFRKEMIPGGPDLMRRAFKGATSSWQRAWKHRRDSTQGRVSTASFEAGRGHYLRNADGIQNLGKQMNRLSRQPPEGNAHPIHWVYPSEIQARFLWNEKVIPLPFPAAVNTLGDMNIALSIWIPCKS